MNGMAVFPSFVSLEMFDDRRQDLQNKLFITRLSQPAVNGEHGMDSIYVCHAQVGQATKGVFGPRRPNGRQKSQTVAPAQMQETGVYYSRVALLALLCNTRSSVVGTFVLYIRCPKPSERNNQQKDGGIEEYHRPISRTETQAFVPVKSSYSHVEHCGLSRSRTNPNAELAPPPRRLLVLTHGVSKTQPAFHADVCVRERK